jgi:hypothetical protein
MLHFVSVENRSVLLITTVDAGDLVNDVFLGKRSLTSYVNVQSVQRTRECLLQLWKQGSMSTIYHRLKSMNSLFSKERQCILQLWKYMSWSLIQNVPR